MTVEVLTEAPDDAEQILIAWLSPLRRTAVARMAGDVLPFTVVGVLPAGVENVDLSYQDPVVQVDVLCDKALGYAAAADEANLTHKRMRLMARFLEPVALTGGRFATIDYCKVFTIPHREDYGDDQIVRHVARYQLGLSYV